MLISPILLNGPFCKLPGNQSTLFKRGVPHDSLFFENRPGSVVALGDEHQDGFHLVQNWKYDLVPFGEMGQLLDDL